MVQFQFLDYFRFISFWGYFNSIFYLLQDVIYIYKYMRQFFFHESGVLIMFMVAYIKGIPW